jgi:CRISPR-associated protein Csd2
MTTSYPLAPVPEALHALYEVHNFKHAAEVLSSSCAQEFAELCQALSTFRITKEDLLSPGGNESQIPKKVASLLRRSGWFETRIRGDLIVRIETHSGDGLIKTEHEISDFLDGHKIDFVKDRVAFDLEWNSKDQTFDRDLYAFRAFHEAGVISAGVLLTRSESMNEVFKKLGIMKKYGASTTWMGKLLYRLKAGRNGGCPVLVLGITPALIEGWQE